MPTFDEPQSRNEAILQNMLGAENELPEPQSRIEDLLLQILDMLQQGGGSGLTDDVKQALLDCFDHVAWADDDGGDAYNALEDLFYPIDSISAVYTQSGTVAPGDSLDSLKTDLVVTALYEDGTSAVVPATDYTLSGTLVTGDSTITVTYHSKTTTFTVVVTGDLPSAYAQRDYIERTVGSDGNLNQNQCIFTKTYTDLNVLSAVAEFGFNTGVRSGGAPVIGARIGNAASKNYTIYVKTGAAALTAHGTASNYSQTFSTTPNKKHIFTFTNTAATPSSFAVDSNAATPISWAETEVVNLPLIVCGVHWGSAYQVFIHTQCGRVKLYDLSGNLVSDYIPCVRIADGVIGMYETVDGVFYTTSDASYATEENTNCLYTAGTWSE